MSNKLYRSKNTLYKKFKSKPTIFKISIFIIAILLFLFILGIVYMINTINKVNYVKLDNTNLGITDEENLVQYEEYTKIKNIMLFGTDSSESNSNGRSDSMMILTVDPIHDKIKITSLMRDCYVPIEGFGEDKLNHAYAFGGPELSIKTINETFGLNIEEFATVDFSSLPKLIDLVGGIEIDITSDELDDVNEVIKMDNKSFKKNTPLISSPGMQTLTGDQALSYSRNRSSSGGDFARTQRQRKIIKSLFSKALEVPFSSYPSILNKALPLITTNMTYTDILTLAQNILSISTESIEQARFPLDEYSQGGYIGDFWYLIYDRETTKKQLQDYIFDDKLPQELVNKLE